MLFEELVPFQLEGADDEHPLRLIDIRKRVELGQHVVEHGLAGQVDQRFGFAPGVGAHAGAITRHGDGNCQVICQSILPNSLSLPGPAFPGSGSRC